MEEEKRPIDRRELKLRARQAMRESRPGAMRVTLVYLLLAAGISAAVGLLIPSPLTTYTVYTAMGADPETAVVLALGQAGGISFFLNILLTLLTMVLSFGYSAWALGRSRGEELGYRELFHGFRMAGRVIGMRLWVLVLTFLWGLAVAIPAALLIGGLVGALLLVGVSGGADGAVYLSDGAAIAVVVLVLVIYLAAIVLLAIITLRYAMSDYTLLDAPEAGAFAAVRRSRELMRGRKRAYFVLLLSFLGWFLLVVLLMLLPMAVCTALLAAAVLSAPVLVLPRWMLMTALAFLLPLPLECWLAPYVSLTCANFYNELIGRGAPRPQTPEWEFPAL